MTNQTNNVSKKRSWVKIVLIGILVFLLLSSVGLGIFFFSEKKKYQEAQSNLRIGFTADWEYGYKSKVGNKPTNKAPEALQIAVDYFNNEFHPEIVIAGGDLVESSISKKNTTIEQFYKINEIFQQLQAKRGYVFGNHDLRDLTKEEIRNILGMEANHTYYDIGEWRLVLMDTNFQKDGSDLGPNYYIEGLVSDAEFDWLKKVMETERPTILFSHHSSIPVETDGQLSGNTKNMANGMKLHNFLKGYDNLVIFVSGHESGYRFRNVDGINYLLNGNLATFELLGNFISMEARYNKYTNEAEIDVEKHGLRAEKFLVSKEIEEISDWKKWLITIFERPNK